MFPWRNFAKSAEATFSRWALKRVCKFFLKKKLGQFILGDLDLDQLDVQLSEGTIQLSDLALNVDFVNTKFGKKSSIMIKEGSIGYLLIKMPWSGKGCEVEVNGLELVVSPCLDKMSTSEDETCGMDNSNNHHHGYSSTRTEHGISDDAEKLASMDVHEGVKTIAKMIKWLLTSFHVTVTNVIVAFDPSVDNVENKTHCHHTLVLQISEIQCGTSLSEDADLNVDVLGISQLTNFVKFHGAVIELLQIDNEDFYFQHESSAGCDEPVLGSNIATCPVMTGNKGGFSGSIKLSIPWKNGSLDICKVDAVAHVDPIVLRFQPSSIKWLLQSWETLKNLNKNGKGCTNHNVRGSAQLNSTLLRHSSTSVSIGSASSEIITADGSLSAEYASLIQPETLAEDLLPAANVISDWVPLSTHTSHNKDGIQELDFGASVDQFFECFDGMRNSQSALGNSGMWNWTYSVFSAITAASSLASGSLHIPSEQQHMETNFSATFAGVSVVLSCCVDEQKKFSDTEIGHKDGLQIDYLGAECNNIVFALQVCPQGMTLDAKVRHIEVANFWNIGVDAKNQTALVQHLQAKVLDALPSSTCYNIDSHSLIGSVATDFPFGNNDCLLKVTLFRTFGVMNCKFSVQSSSSDGCLIGNTSFSLSLPPFSFWVIFSVINVLMNLLKEVEKSLGMHNKEKEILSEALDIKCAPSQSNMKEGSSPCVISFSPTQCLHGDISISNARVILCFPFERDGDHNNSFPWEQFIALDFTSSSPLNNGCAPVYSQSSNASSKKRFPSVSAQSLQLSFCDLDIYLITSSNENGGIISYDVQNEKFSASCFFSIFHRRGCFSVFRVVLQEGKVTGPWIAKKARLFANSEQTRGKEDTGRRGDEFVSVSTVKDLEEWKSQTQQEMILSSSFLIHVHLSQLVINMNYSQYKGIHHLLHQTLNALTCAASKQANVEKESSVSQSSVFLECDSLEILIDRDTSERTKSSIKSELPGIWCQFRLKVQQFEVLSVTNTGGIKAANFFRLAHGEGKLWGSVTGLPDHEFLLITCSNSVVKRGDGGGSNTLSSKFAGSEVICLSDPEISVAVTSITVSCGTVIAVGGRLDWFNAISSFFCLPASNTEGIGDHSVLKEEHNNSHTTYFALCLIDIALSYEPYLKNPAVQSELNSESSCSFIKEDMSEQCVSCLLAASSLTLSNSSSADTVENVFQIRVHDLGLLLHLISELNSMSDIYSVEHLQKSGYVKVSQEAFMEAILKTNCTSSLLWELELSKSHVNLETCYDTTAGLIRLAAQLQQLFAPDVEESIVHLQNRWHNVQKAQQRNELKIENKNCRFDSMSAISEQCSPHTFSMDGSRIAGWMDEICEDAFKVNNNNTPQSYPFESGIPLDGSLIEVGQMNLHKPEVLSHELTLTEPVSVPGPEGSDTSFLQEGCFPEIIESYCLSDLRPLSELSLGIHCDELSRHKLRNVEHKEIERGSGRWYGGTSLKVLENHIAEENKQPGMKKAVDHQGMLSSDDSSTHGETCGRVILKKIDIRWRMYGGSDWLDPEKSGQHSGRDTSICMELALSGLKFQYDIYPVGGLHVSKMSVSVKDFYLYDRSHDAPWKLVLGYYHSKGHPRESFSKAFKLDLDAVRPDPLTPLEEYRLNVTILPLLLHLHQRQLDFFVDFFGRKNTLKGQFPNSSQDLEGSKSLLEKTKQDKGHVFHSVAPEALLPYFQKLDIWPILVRVDYSPTHVDLAALRNGKYVELVNLVPWKGIELNLKHVHASGVYGWASVCETAVGDWLEDISQNQIHKILRGLPTVRSLIAVGAGAAKLVSSPVESYKKERRVLKGVQRGTIAFLRSISLEAVGLGVHLAAGAHDILLQAEYILSSIPSPVPLPVKDKIKTDVRSNQPKDAQEGIQQAYESLSDGLGKSAAVLVQSPLKKFQRGSGAGPALAAAVRAVPAAAIAPASACASAVHCALLGFRNSLDPERKKESMEKYCPAQPWEED
ncbi:autophagy-related protein 2 isoform X1 [Vigna radiata var. radiata]|uniref:Autophagy-related protein 2 n=1 Tax=Vigna radiata var. radiata TaxID=3916 RepID=A0A1S3URN3_VIGRR|nr:autophagy-related protein 2 isoform X1 [Vigna radiata var. radiata]